MYIRNLYVPKISRFLSPDTKQQLNYLACFFLAEMVFDSNSWHVCMHLKHQLQTLII